MNGMTASEKQTYLYTATCLFGLEGLLGEEIDALGYTRETTMDGRIYFRFHRSSSRPSSSSL